MSLSACMRHCIFLGKECISITTKYIYICISPRCTHHSSVTNSVLHSCVAGSFFKKKICLEKISFPSTSHCHSHTAQGWNNRTPISHERRNVRLLVLPGSLCIFTEMTESSYFSLISTAVEFTCKGE